jgi:hypothetical protein
MKSIKLLVFIYCLLLLFTARQALAQTPSPTILETTLLKADYGDQIMVKGLASKDVAVLIYINGSYNGLANISNNDPDLNNFSYLSPIIEPSSSNNHSVTAISRNLKDFSLSSPTESKVFSVIEQSYFKKTDQPKNPVLKPSPKTNEDELTVPAPKLIAPTGNINDNRPVISGFSKNETIVKLYIDNIPEAEILVKNDNSGTAKFKYTPSRDLSRGLHFVYAVATNLKGKESVKSNLLYFFISQPQFTATSSAAEIKTEQPQISVESINDIPTQEKEQTVPKGKVQKIIGPALNISLLVLFALGVVIWIITTNMELKKERSEEKKSNDQPKK